MIGLSLGADAPARRGSVGWAPEGVAAALDFRRGLYALPATTDIAAATEAELENLRPAGLAEMLAVFRASSAAYTDAAGQLQTAGPDQPRFDWTHGKRQFLVEREATNLFANPFSPATQTVQVVDGNQYTISCRGAGTITLSGAATGTASAGAPAHVTASGSALTCTVSGSLEAAQVEFMYGANSAMNTGSSFIDGDRAMDLPEFAQRLLDLWNRPEVTVLVQFGRLVDFQSNKRVLDPDGGDWLGTWQGANAINAAPSSPKLTAAGGLGIDADHAVAFAFDASGRASSVWDAGGAVLATDNKSARSTTVSQLRLMTSGGGLFSPCVWIDAVHFWPRRLSDAELLAVTKPYGA